MIGAALGMRKGEMTNIDTRRAKVVQRVDFKSCQVVPNLRFQTDFYGH